MLSLAFRIGTELVAALVVGVGGGVLIDSWLDCRPWGMVIGFVLGAGGGVSNVYRAVNGLGYAVGYQQQPDTAKPPDDASPGPP
jgi:ATP synthase protein I